VAGKAGRRDDATALSDAIRLLERPAAPGGRGDDGEAAAQVVHKTAV